MINTCLALFTALTMLASSASAQSLSEGGSDHLDDLVMVNLGANDLEVADGPRDGVVKIIADPNRGGCTGYVIGGTIVMTVPRCIFEEGESRPREGLNVIAGMHNHLGLEGRNPKPLDRYFVDHVHVDPTLYSTLRSGGYQFNGPGSRTIVFLNIRTHPGAPDFDDNTRGINAVLERDVFSSVQSTRTSRFALFGYSNDIRSNAVITSRCSSLSGRGGFIGADCINDAGGLIGAPLFDLATNQAMGLSVATFNDGQSAFVPFRNGLKTDIMAMLDGQTGGFFELRTFDISPDYFIGVDVWNKCRKTIFVGVRYKDPDTDEWRTDGFWEVKPGALRILPLETKNRYIFWTAYAEGDDHYGWRGDREVDYRGTTLEMIEVNAGENWNDVRLQPTCSNN